MPHPLVLWTIRLSGLLYALALVQFLTRRNPRPAWTLACLLYLAHVLAAFHFSYHWSHQFAVAETARQTQALFGLHWGGGVWFNYAFTAIWTLDAAWWNFAPQSHRLRPLWITRSIHIYLAWMFFNGAIVFPQGPTRWAALTLVAALLLLLGYTRRQM